MRFVSPETVRITLADGPNGDKNWIDVKKDLTAGEEKRYRSAGLRRMTPRADANSSSEIDIDWLAMALARVEAYLVDWSAKKPDGKDLPVTRQAIEALETTDFDEIDTAIQKHMDQRLEEKKQTNGSPAPIETSP